MRVIVNDKMKEWVKAYIRAHRTEGCISIHVVFSKFNKDFKTTFNIDPVMIINLMITEGFLCGRPAKLGFSIWLPEDSGMGQNRPFRSRVKPAEVIAAPTQQNKELLDFPAQKGENEMKKKSEESVIDFRFSFEQVPHPVTGEVNVLKLIRHVMECAAKQIPHDVDMDGGYAVYQPKFVHLFEAAGLPDSSRPDLTHIMMKMGLFKKYSRQTWGVLHSKAAGYFITTRSYLAARESYIEHRDRNHEVARLRNKVEMLEAANIELTPTQMPFVPTTLPSATFEDEAIAALLEAERFSEELAKSEVKFKEVENELAETQAKVKAVEIERDNLAVELKNRPAEVEVFKQAFHERLSALKLVRNV